MSGYDDRYAIAVEIRTLCKQIQETNNAFESAALARKIREKVEELVDARRQTPCKECEARSVYNELVSDSDKKTADRAKELADLADVLKWQSQLSTPVSSHEDVFVKGFLIGLLVTVVIISGFTLFFM